MASKTRPCAVCRQMIDPERAASVPETRLCIEHAEKIKKHGGEFLSTGTVERTSKAGSLKHNYGSVSVSRTRNDAGLAKLIDEYLREQEAGA